MIVLGSPVDNLESSPVHIRSPKSIKQSQNTWSFSCFFTQWCWCGGRLARLLLRRWGGHSYWDSRRWRHWGLRHSDPLLRGLEWLVNVWVGTETSELEIHLVRMLTGAGDWLELRGKESFHWLTIYMEIWRNKNRNIAIAMSSSRADLVMGLNILQGWLEGFKWDLGI